MNTLRPVALLAGLAMFALGPVGFAAEPVLLFNRDVRPILADKCFGCHGPDAKNKGVPIRLDKEEDAKRELSGGRRAIVPGDPTSSVVIQRIRSERKGLLMPPHYSGLTLTAKEIETLTQWVAQGAQWQQHWSFTPVVRPVLPATQEQWGRGAIDKFVLARLAQEKLRPQVEASPETLVRRVTLDLTGLPPTPEEVAAYVQDKSPQAYETLVNRLLQSPRFGERMAARWLDAARYADSNGYQYDGERVMWRWRDYVIESFNRNKPFDRFVTEQVAGDLLANPTMEQRLATGFNRNHRINTEDGIVPAEYAVEYVVDRVETVGAAFMGLTTGCARCHNHKYDPLTQKEFYQLFALFNNIPESGRGSKYGNSYPTMPAPTAQQQVELAKLQGEEAPLRAVLAHEEKSIRKAEQQWVRQMAKSGGSATVAPRGFENGYFPLEGGVAGRVGQAQQFQGKDVLTDTTSGRFEITDPYTISAWVYGDGAVPTGTIVSRMSSDNFKIKGYGLHIREGRVYFSITSIWADDGLRVQTKPLLQPNRWHHVAVTFDGSKLAEGTKLFVDGQQQPFEILLNTLYRPFGNAGGVFKADLKIGGGAGPENRLNARLDDLRIYSRELQPEEVAVLHAGANVGELASLPALTAAQQAALRQGYLEQASAPKLRDVWTKLTANTDAQRKLARTFPSAMVMQEMPERKQSFLLQRGAYDKPGEAVEPGLPAFLSPPATPVKTRLAFAQWLTAPTNPLLARVTVNRFWQMLFGTGIVKTTEDFGLQGEWPSHPELLDWLAADFIGNGFDVKQSMKSMVMSATYRQASSGPTTLWQKDPENRLLARGPRVRMPAELIRDSALAVSGLLHEKVGGPSVKPYQPEGLWAEVTMQDMPYNRAKGEELYRRGLYTFWKRTAAPPMMLNFDASGREVCSVRETRTNTPLQALNLMNDVTFVEAARQVGARMLREASGVDARLERGFMLVFGRKPTAKEREIVRASLNYHLDRFATKPDAALALLKQGDSPAPAGLAPAEAAAYMSVASMLMNTDEFVTKE